MKSLSSSSIEAKKRPNGITVVAILWALISVFTINRGLDNAIYNFSYLPALARLYDPSASEWLDLSLGSREWLSFGVPLDIVLSLALVVLSLLAIFTVYGLFTARAWSYQSSFVVCAFTAITDSAIGGFYASAPAELGFATESSLYFVLAAINVVWLGVLGVYLRKPNSKQYLIGPRKPIPSGISPAPTPNALISPSYWGTQEGDVIKAIVSHDRSLTWSEIHQATGLDENSLNKALSNLFSSREIQKVGDTHERRYRVSHELYSAYNTYLWTDFRTKRQADLVEWIRQWKEVKKLEFSLEHEHFFLEGRYLDDFSKELISHAKSEVLVVNPFIQDCDLSNTLRDVKRRGVDVQIITRSPRDKIPEYQKNKQEYLSRLQKDGVSVVYNEKVHAKLIVVDRAVAIVSSMNFFPDSSAGVSWEAGLITNDGAVVESIFKSAHSKLV